MGEGIVTLSLDAEGATKRLNSFVVQTQNKIAAARGIAAQGVIDRIKALGDVNILNGGKFTSRWTSAWTVNGDPKPTKARLADPITITGYFKGIPYAHIFEFGGTIRPKKGEF